ncbi:unnamed protein product [Adineta steineri]|uniref:Leucine-rich repeat and WD repeat-containing protein n=1 Tax=Adineta steineri TaxID=433720 RepID=A0A819DB97_9BILA|nr:unnamed protein product [Adineta steineri]CAF3831705.1 unnamed protein product [Adineta steineri]
MSSPPKRLRKHSQNEFISLMISSKRLPSTSYNHITELNLSNLQLIKIDTFPFEYLPKLVSLDLSYNQLISINTDWSKARENFIEHLNVSHNKLETLLFLKDFKHLKQLNVTENFLRNTERFLSLHLCPTIEHLIDSNHDQIDDDQIKLDQWLQIIETKIDRLWALSYYDKYKQEIGNEKNHQMVKQILDDFHHAMIKIFEKQTHFSQMHLSPLANYLITNKISELCLSLPKIQTKKSLKTHLTEDFNDLMDVKTNFEPIKFFRCHQTNENDLTTISVRMSLFEPNTSQNILATCGGQKVCFIDCDTCEVSHLYEVSSLRSTTTTRKIKDKNSTINSEYFSCLCWIEITEGNETLKVLAVGATNGHIYLLSHKWKIMFAHIELPSSSISCLIWDPSQPTTLVTGSYNTVRFLNIKSYLDRFRSFVRKQNKPATQFDYVESTLCDNKISSTHVYHFDNGDDTVINITDLLFYPMSKDNHILLVGTTSGLFIIHDQTPKKLTFPKSMWTIGEYIESIRLINIQTRLIAINILGLDQIFCFDLEQSLPPSPQLHIILTLANPYRQIATKMDVYVTTNENDNNNGSFECIIGSDHGSFFYHQIRMNAINNKKTKKATFDNKRYEITWPQVKTSTTTIITPSLLSANLNENYLCLTTSNNLICIYKRK